MKTGLGREFHSTINYYFEHKFWAYDAKMFIEFDGCLMWGLFEAGSSSVHSSFLKLSKRWKLSSELKTLQKKGKKGYAIDILLHKWGMCSIGSRPLCQTHFGNLWWYSQLGICLLFSRMCLCTKSKLKKKKPLARLAVTRPFSTSHRAYKIPLLFCGFSSQCISKSTSKFDQPTGFLS